MQARYALNHAVSAQTRFIYGCACSTSKNIPNIIDIYPNSCKQTLVRIIGVCCIMHTYVFKQHNPHLLLSSHHVCSTQEASNERWALTIAIEQRMCASEQLNLVAVIAVTRVSFSYRMRNILSPQMFDSDAGAQTPSAQCSLQVEMTSHNLWNHVPDRTSTW